MARTFKIVGDLTVAGKTAGETLTEAELADANVEALVEGGHIAPITSKAAKAAAEEQ